MLHGLLANQSVEKILFFLLVNERAYASQLARIFGCALTPFQRALDKLEKSSLLTSFQAGKTKLFELNRDYPLYFELEALLKRAYTLLPPEEKKRYYFIKREMISQERSKHELLDLAWDRLRSIQSVKLEFRSGKEILGKGMGKVECSYDPKGVLIYKERGTWKSKANQSFGFCNTYRWTINRLETMLSLEHLRLGPDRPVFLFHLTPTGDTIFESLHAHLCAEDTYFGLLLLHKDRLELVWRILGPKKNEEIYNTYS